MPNKISLSGLSAHCDHTRPFNDLTDSPFRDCLSILATPPGPAGSSAAAEIPAVNKPAPKKAVNAVMMTPLFIPCPSFIKYNITAHLFKSSKEIDTQKAEKKRKMLLR